MKKIIKISVRIILLLGIIAIINACKKSDDSTAPSVTTAVISGITQTGAVSGGNVTDDNGSNVTARGVVWGTAANPTTAGSHTSDGTGKGTFTSNISGLTAGTLYHVKAYATNGKGTTYGNELTFTTTTTGSLASLTTTAASAITGTTAVSGGNITDDNGSDITMRGVAWGIAANPDTTGTHTTDGTGTGIFISNISGLTAGTLYYVRAYAVNGSGIAYGDEVTFTTTTSSLASLTTTVASVITDATAMSGGNITNDNGSAITARGVVWGTTASPVISGSHSTDGTGTGTFTSSITGLTAGTLYYVRAYATNANGTAYGDEISFTTTTTGTLATLTTTAVTAITATTATSGGDITNDNGSDITARGVCWSTTANPTTADSHTSDATGVGVFVSSLTSLTTGTLYYVRAYATSSAGTAYGNEVSFTTN